jgi:hemerythrin-like domain-containing protein
LEIQVDLYTGIHKGQRARFSIISKEAGTLNIPDKEATQTLANELAAFRDHMYLHAKLEENFIHPLLSKRTPGGADRLEEDHRVMHKQLDYLVADFAQINDSLADFEKREDLALEFYRAWNRFAVFYLNHIDYEEEYVMPTLWKLCTQGELSNTFRQILADQTPPQLMDNLAMMLPAMNPKERQLILTMGKATMPTEAFQGVLKLAQRVLAPEDWNLLENMLK